MTLADWLIESPIEVTSRRPSESSSALMHDYNCDTLMLISDQTRKCCVSSCDYGLSSSLPSDVSLESLLVYPWFCHLLAITHASQRRVLGLVLGVQRL